MGNEPLTQANLEAALAGLPLGMLRYLPSTGSTNDEAARLAADDAPDLSLVLADEQRRGRGRLERRWFTPPGAALAVSLVLRQPADDTAALAHLTALGALAVCLALQEVYQLPAEIKWPNDVLVNGRKCTGVLVETFWIGSQLEAAILGIGINVSPAAVPPAADLLFPATSVESELGSPVERLELLRAVLARLLTWRAQLGSPAFLHAWEARLALRGELVRVVSQSGEGAESETVGEIVGLAADGALRLRTPAGTEVAIQFGELRLRRA